MSLTYIRKTYDVPAEVGRRVTVDGRPGIIVSDEESPHIQVHFDGDKPAQSYPCHPTWKVEYGELQVSKVPKLTRSQRRYQEYLRLDFYGSFREFLASGEPGAA